MARKVCPPEKFVQTVLWQMGRIAGSTKKHSVEYLAALLARRGVLTKKLAAEVVSLKRLVRRKSVPEAEYKKRSRAVFDVLAPASYLVRA